MNTQDQIKNGIRKAKETHDAAGLEYWQTLQWMSKRRSMKGWSLDQLKEQYERTQLEHNITRG